MPELRKDPVLARWVIIASERVKRPSDFIQSPQMREKEAEQKDCPFCEGRESLTPPEVFSFRTEHTRPNEPGWRVRVVANQFPALRIEEPLKRQAEGVYDRMAGCGAHEVIIETPNHNQQLADLDRDSIVEVLKAYKERVIDLKKDPRFKYILIFKNHGPSAGASLSHSHSQLIAMPVIPKLVKEEMDGALKYWEFRERCIFCDIQKQELAEKKRIIIESERFIAFEPFAPVTPFETWILARRHFSAFAHLENQEIIDLAAILKESLARINRTLDKPDYNYLIHSGPLDMPNLDYYHFHLEIFPKLTKFAGFEIGSGFYINHIPPEQAAKYLKQISE